MTRYGHSLPASDQGYRDAQCVLQHTTAACVVGNTITQHEVLQ